MPERRDPFSELDELIERMNRQFGELSRSFEGGFESDVNVDVADQGDRLVVTADLPGFDGDDIDVRVDGESLVIRAEYEADEATEDAQYHRRERRHQSISRRIRLPTAVDAGGASARHNNGVLTVTLPKLDPDTASGHRIDVE